VGSTVSFVTTERSAPVPDITRRRLLQGAGTAAAAAFAAEFLPNNIRKAIASGPSQGGSLRDIKHVVILMQENRSFDQYFGTLPSVRGFSDPNVIKQSSGQPIWYQPDTANPDGYLLPFHLDTTTTSAQAIGPIGGGFRVPCLIVSPWTMGGWIASENFDHTFTLQFLELLTGVTIPNITPWRRQTFGKPVLGLRQLHRRVLPEAAGHQGGARPGRLRREQPARTGDPDHRPGPAGADHRHSSPSAQRPADSEGG
jgi:phospholipase C